jgi:hypothetical protein
MYLPSIRLAQSNNQDAGMRSRAELRETPVRGDQNTLAGLRGSPQSEIIESLIGRSTDVKYSVTEFPQMLHSHSRDILVDENSHPSADDEFNRRNLLFSQASGIIEACHHVLPRYPRVCRQQIVDGVTIGQHSHDLVDRDPCAFHARLPVTNERIDRDPISKSHARPSLQPTLFAGSARSTV